MFVKCILHCLCFTMHNKLINIDVIFVNKNYLREIVLIYSQVMQIYQEEFYHAKKKFSNKCTINFYCIIAKEFVINTFHLYLYFEQNFLLRSPLEGIPLYHPRNILNNISITVLSLLIFMTWNGSFWFCSTIPTAMCTSGRSRSFAVCVAWMFQWYVTADSSLTLEIVFPASRTCASSASVLNKITLEYSYR